MVDSWRCRPRALSERVNQSKHFINHNVGVVVLRGDLANRDFGISQVQASFAIVAYCLGV
ncbi:hypothetical protein CN059_18965 [Sinorhizobium medicae]|nr:hypothetical protein BMJ25_07165 [Sinorhizobium medicae]RVQ46259.1 hypothetical protein CN059_18965 [Sinorhizobium medicae]